MRCRWANCNQLLMNYHDHEWGVPQFNEMQLFESLSLEIFQAGLRWDLILKKRPYLERAFEGFDYQKVAQYSVRDVERLLHDRSIIRNVRKITAVIDNARVLSRISSNGTTLESLTWRNTHGVPLDHLLSKDQELDSNRFTQRFLKWFRHYHFSRVGPKTLYSYLQAVGVINDHWIGCFRHEEIVIGRN